MASHDVYPERNQDSQESDENEAEKEELLERLRAVGYLNATETVSPQKKGVTLLNKNLADPGFNLYSDGTNEIYLLEQDGELAHVWRLARQPFRQLYAELVSGGQLATISGSEAFMLIDAEARAMWKLPGLFHHDLVENPDGSFLVIYGAAMKYQGRSVLFDGLKRVTRHGEPEKAWFSFDHLDELRKHHEPSELDTPLVPTKAPARHGRYDYYHMNTVSRLPDTELGRKDARFKSGNLLVCLRNANMIAVLNHESFAVEWSWGPGILDLPHQPTMLETGSVLVFDNGTYRGFSRVLEMDPVSGEIVWKYEGSPKEDFYTRQGGGVQRLSNGNTLITETYKGHAFEVTRSGEVVWDFWNPNMQGPKRRTIYRMTRLTAGEVAPILGWERKTGRGRDAGKPNDSREMGGF